MNAELSKNFIKQLRKLPVKKQKSALEAIDLYITDKNTPRLRLHDLKGQWQGYNSISAGGDLRLHLKTINKNTTLFVAIGSHSQLYK